MPTPQISIVVPVYCVEKYIRRCVESLINQTFSDIDIIFVDDCSTDHSVQIIEEYAHRDPRIRILHQEKNSGQGACRNWGIQISQAPYIMFCDSDDYYAPTMCEKMYTAIQNAPQADMAMCNFTAFYEYDVATPGFKPFTHCGFKRMTRQIKENTYMYVWSRIYRRDFLNQYNIRFPEGYFYEDWYFYHVCAAHARGIFFLTDKLYHYRRRKNSTSHVKEVSGVDYLPIGIMLWEYAKKHDFLKKDNGYLIEVCSLLIDFGLFYSIKSGQKTAALKTLKDFIAQENITRENIPLPLLNALAKNMGMNGLKQRHLGSIIKVREDFWEKTTYLFGMSILKDRFHFDMVTRRMLSFKKRHTFSSEQFFRFPEYDSTLLDVLKELDTFTYIPSPGDMGDVLATAATLRYFDSNSLRYIIYKEWLAADHIVFGGGDFWSNEDESAWEQFLPLFRQANKVVILPSRFKNCDKLFHILDERFTVFCSDADSYRYLTSVPTGASIILDHDMSTRAVPQMATHHVPHPKNPARCYNTLRACLESSQAGVAMFMSSDDADHYINLAYTAHIDGSTSRNNIFFNAKFLLCLVGMYQTIVTDHPRVGIAAALMGREVYMIGEDCEGIYNQSLSQYAHVHFANKMPEHVAAKSSLTPQPALMQHLTNHFTRLSNARLKAFDILNESQC